MNRLKEIRTARNLTQANVAAFLNITRPAYTNIENGKRNIDNVTLGKLAELFNTSADYILGLDQPSKKEPTVEDDGLKGKVIRRVRALSDPELAQLSAFLDGLLAGREIASAAQAAADPDAPPSE